MPFHFTLQAVLRLRTSYEQMEKLRLLAITAAIARAHEEIAALQNESRAARQHMQGRLGTGVLAGELRFEDSSENVRLVRKSAAASRLAELEKKQVAQREAYRTARQKREILVNLRQKQWDEYRGTQARREQQRVDESFLLHRGRSNEDTPD